MLDHAPVDVVIEGSKDRDGDSWWNTGAPPAGATGARCVPGLQLPTYLGVQSAVNVNELVPCRSQAVRGMPLCVLDAVFYVQPGPIRAKCQ